MNLPLTATDIDQIAEGGCRSLAPIYFRQLIEQARLAIELKAMLEPPPITLGSETYIGHTITDALDAEDSE